MNTSNTMPSALANRPRRGVLEAMTANLGASRPAHLSIKGGRFALVDAGGNVTPVQTYDPHTGPYVDIVILDASENTSKLFYGRAWSPDSDDPPICYSDNGTGPSINALEPQAPTCAICPHNVRGSALSPMTGQGIKACRDQKKVAFIVPGDESLTVYEMTITPGSLTNLKAYGNFVSSQVVPGASRKADVVDFVTRVSFEPDKTGILQFACQEWADDDYTVQCVEYVHTNQLSDKAVGRDDIAREPDAVRQLIEARAQGKPALPAPSQPATAAPSQKPQFQLPPRTGGASIPPASQVPPPAADPTPAPKPRGRKPSGGAGAATLPPPQPEPEPEHTGQAYATQAASPEPTHEGIPTFLRRAPAGRVPQRTEDAPRPIGAAPPPPSNVQGALAQAMNLPTRRT